MHSLEKLGDQTLEDFVDHEENVLGSRPLDLHNHLLVPVMDKNNAKNLGQLN